MSNGGGMGVTMGSGGSGMTMTGDGDYSGCDNASCRVCKRGRCYTCTRESCVEVHTNKAMSDVASTTTTLSSSQVSTNSDGTTTVCIDGQCHIIP